MDPAFGGGGSDARSASQSRFLYLSHSRCLYVRCKAVSTINTPSLFKETLKNLQVKKVEPLPFSKASTSLRFGFLTYAIQSKRYFIEVVAYLPSH